MPDICFSEEENGAWVVAGWAFRQLLDDVARQYPDQTDVQAEVTRAKEVGYLHVDSLEGALSAKMTDAIRDVAAGILSGTIPSGLIEQHGDDPTAQEYKKGLQMLLKAAR
jgi:hypothetical protein